MEHRAADISTLKNDVSGAVEYHHRPVERIFVNTGSIAAHQLDGPELGQLISERLGGPTCPVRRGSAPRHARLPLTIAAGEINSSICARLSRPRSATISATPRPLSRASWAMSVAFSYPMRGLRSEEHTSELQSRQ